MNLFNALCESILNESAPLNLYGKQIGEKIPIVGTVGLEYIVDFFKNRGVDLKSKNFTIQFISTSEWQSGKPDATESEYEEGNIRVHERLAKHDLLEKYGWLAHEIGHLLNPPGLKGEPLTIQYESIWKKVIKDNKLIRAEDFVKKHYQEIKNLVKTKPKKYKWDEDKNLNDTISHSFMGYPNAINEQYPMYYHFSYLKDIGCSKTRMLSIMQDSYSAQGTLGTWNDYRKMFFSDYFDLF